MSDEYRRKRQWYNAVRIVNSLSAVNGDNKRHLSTTRARRRNLSLDRTLFFSRTLYSSRSYKRLRFYDTRGRLVDVNQRRFRRREKAVGEVDRR